MVALLCKDDMLDHVLYKNGEKPSCKLKLYNLQERSSVQYWNRVAIFSCQRFYTNLVQFLPQYHVIISKVHVYSFACTISHVHRRAPKTALRAIKIIIYEGLTNKLIIKIVIMCHRILGEQRIYKEICL